MKKMDWEISFPQESIFLSDKKGGYFALDGGALTAYQGLFHFLDSEWELYKTIDNIYPVGIKEESLEHTSIVMQDGFFERNTEHITERFLFSENNFIYEIHGNKEVILDLDFRRIHDFNDKGRIYKISKEKDFLIIEYDKYSDLDLNNLVEIKFLAIKGVGSYDLINEWIKKDYAYDKSRGTKFEFYVYRALKLSVEELRLVFGFGATKKDAINSASKKVNVNIKNLMLNTEIASSALNNLVVTIPHKKQNVTGIFAGYPWFYQFWGRDESISLIGLIKEKKYDQTKEIIMRLIKSLDDNGALHNRWPESKLKSADATVWLFKRVHQLLIELEKENKLKKLFSTKDLELIYEKLCLYVQYTKTLMKDDLIFNNALETWMDTADREGRDTRSGARIEIQALTLATYSLGEDLTILLKFENADFTILKEKLREKIKHVFLKDEMIADGYLDGQLDLTLRPNIFLAYYAYPHLFSREEWKSAFDKVIDSCFLDWGGFSTIDKKSYMFCLEHTGITNESYHRGDSWFFINNIAATCMIHLDKLHFHEYIKTIRLASVKEMTHLGFLGQCAEVSSAKELCSRGALAQAWSAATLIELLHEYNKEE